jgi:hypothetical protein
VPTDSLSLDEFQKIVAGMGFECSRAPNGQAFTFVAEGYKLAGATLQSDKVLQLFCGFDDVKPTLDFVNAWNREHLFCRAFVGDEGTSKFCYELDLSGGCATDTNVQEFVKLFRNVVAEYARLCLQHTPVRS